MSHAHVGGDAGSAGQTMRSNVSSEAVHDGQCMIGGTKYGGSSSGCAGRVVEGTIVHSGLL